jgi:hypothetical protein
LLSRFRALPLLFTLILVSVRASEIQAQERGEIVAPKPESELVAPYPEGAHGDAEVALELLISEDGSVASTRVTQGEEPFAEAARHASEAFRFAPALRAGIPVRARIAVKLSFREPQPPRTSPAAPVARDTPESATDVTSAPQPEQPKPPDQIVVLGEQRAELSSIHIAKEEARRVPGAFGDPFRVVEVLPGIAPVFSGLPYFYVRGAPPGSVAYTIDGISVPLLFHVGPGPSVIAPLFIERVDLFPGAYPARFGRAAGAVLAGETAAPSDRSRAEAQARVFDASAAIEQPFADGRGNIALGGRYSYMQALLAAVAPDYDLGYGDYQVRLGYALGANNRLTAFAFGAFDRLRNQARGQTLFDVSFHRLDLRWDHVTATDRLRVGLTGRSDRVLAAPDDVGARGSAQRVNGLRLRAEWEHALTSRARFRAGGDVALDRVEGDREQVEDTFVTYPDRIDRSAGAYADMVLRPTRGVEIVPGLRVDALRSRQRDYVFFDPRLSVRTRLMQGVAYLAGFGVAHQVPATSVRMPGRRPNLLERSPQRSVQATQGVEYSLPFGMLGRTTLFHQFIEIDVEDVHARNFGVEQFLRRNFTEALGGFLSYTLSRSEAVVGPNSGLSAFDRPHVLSAVLGYDLGKGFRAGARAYWYSGRPVTVACPTTDCGPGPAGGPLVASKTIRLPSFFRLDLRFEKKWQWQNGFWLTATAEWFNATLSSEAEQAFYTPSAGIALDRMSALTLPSLGVELGY